MSIWRHDLAANCRKSDLFSACKATVSHPGFSLLLSHRISCCFSRKGGAVGQLIATLLWRRGVTAFGCFIHPTAKISGGLHLPHAVGIVIGEDVSIGENTTIYQNVTIGRSDIREKTSPVIGAHVTIYAGAVIAGAVTIGNGAVVGSNAVVRSDVAPGETVGGVPAKVLATAR